ncbi:MAG: hypothetical protein DI539_15610 [Flavobacterium psychrophilum]|nr:MAG: hypothetical protein DI539_15610 [Flavobacterium psychrophilum]
MKRIIALFVVMLAFGLNANAQQKKAVATRPAANTEALSKQAAFSDAAFKDVNTLSEFVKLTPDQKVKLKSLFEQKHKDFAQNLSDERKAVLSDYVEAQMKSYLDPSQISKIEGNTQLMNILTH